MAGEPTTTDPAATIKPGILGVHWLTGPPLIYVLVGSHANGYVCYWGYGTPEEIRDHGDKVCYEVAHLYFPTIERERYRQ